MRWAIEAFYQATGWQCKVGAYIGIVTWLYLSMEIIPEHENAWLNSLDLDSVRSMDPIELSPPHRHLTARC